MDLNDTIAAISTPFGEAGIGIVRLSGNRALEIVETIFQSPSGRKLQDLPTHKLIYGFILDPHSKEKIDEVLVSVMRAPHTYTREDVVEINCHSGIIALQSILEATLKAGARLAEPGEFTRRAFLNGRIDLSQAEAVLDIVRSRTTSSLKIALHQLEGGLSKEIKKLRAPLIDILAQLEAAVDFSDEDIEPLTKKEILKKTNTIYQKVKELLATAREGQLLREGIKTTIIGRPNVGKSSLLNALLCAERAIVTPIPGTTRDIIEESMSVKGIPLVLRDTAGIRSPRNKVEEIGVKLSEKSLEEADLILCVIDGSQKLNQEDRLILNKVKGKETLIVINKIDLARKIKPAYIQKQFGFSTNRIVQISATQRIGLKELKEAIINLVFKGKLSPLTESLVINVRHRDALRRTKDALSKAIKALKADLSEEFIAVDVREALDALGEIVGETVTEDILDRIFSQFCIGK